MKRLLFTIFVILFSFAQIAEAQFLRNRFRSAPEESNEIDYSKPPKEYTIASIEVVGLVTLDKNAVISLTGLRVGDQIKIPGEWHSTAINKLWKNGIIADVSIFASKFEGNEVDITIELQERPRLSRFSFEGVNKTQESELSDEVNLIRGKVLTDAVIKNTELAVKRYFIEKGYLNTEITIESEADSLLTNYVKMNIVVDKNDRVKVEKINIYGNEHFEDGKIKAKMKKVNEHLRFHPIKDVVDLATNTSLKDIGQFFTNRKEVSFEKVKSYLSNSIKLNFFNNLKFIDDEYQEDKENIISFYNSKGFRDAKILSDSVYAVGDNEINVDLTIDEGIKYYFRDIVWTGNYVYPDSILARVLGVKEGDVYDLDLVQKKLQFDPTGTDVSSLYMDNGYLFFTVTPVELRIDEDSIDLEMRIYEGEQAEVRKVYWKGNDRTNDHVIQREIRINPGEKFSRAKLIRTQRELSQLGYFDPEQIGMVPIPNPADGTVDIEFSLVEKPSDQIELSGGWGGFVGFVGTLGIVFNNFSVKNIPHFENWRPLPVGDGQKLAVRAQANGRFYQNYSLSFTEPWLGGKRPNSLTVSLNHSIQRDNPRIRELYGLTTQGGSFQLSGATLSFGRRLEWPDDYFSLTHSLSYMQYNLNNFRFAADISDGTYNNFTLNTTLARNSIDQPMYPRAGSSLSLSVSLTPPYSLFNDRDYSDLPSSEKFRQLEFHKWMFDAKHYMRIAGNLVMEAKAHMGFIGAYNQDIGVGPFERFVMGGSGLAGTRGQFFLGTDVISMRGYDDNAITPIGENNVQGGTIYNKFGLELRYPVSLKPSATIYLLGFYEAGNNWLSFDEYNPFELFRTAGVGARIFMPAFGLLGIDWGVGFDDKIGNIVPQQQTFQFTIGQQFR